MAPEWGIYLLDWDGNRRALVDDWKYFSVVHEVNKPDAYALHFKGNDTRANLLQDDWRIEAWRMDRTRSIPWTLESQCFHLDPLAYHGSDGDANFISSGKGLLTLLERSIVEAPAGSSLSSKAGPAETVAKEFVSEQVGPTSTHPRTGLTIEATLGRGSAISIQRSYRNLLQVAQECAALGGGDIDIVPTGDATFEFRWYPGQRGTDRRASVIFALERENMAEPKLESPTSGIINSVLVAGQGEGALRTLVWRTDAVDVLRTPWSRVEAFIDARDATTQALLESRGDLVLANTKRTDQLTFRVLQTVGLLYGRDYFIGDLVTARYRGIDYERKISKVTIVVDVDGGERIDVETTDV